MVGTSIMQSVICRMMLFSAAGSWHVNKNDSGALYNVMKNFFPAGNICLQFAVQQILLKGTSNCIS